MAFNVEKAKERNYQKFRQNLKEREKRKVREILKSAFNVEKAKERNYQKFRQNLKEREKRKVREILKSFGNETLPDVDKAIDSGMINTWDLYRDDNYVFAKAIVKEGAEKIALPDTKEAKQIQRQVRYI